MRDGLQRGSDPAAGRGRAMAAACGRVEHRKGAGGGLARTQPGECRDEGCQGGAGGSARVAMGWNSAWKASKAAFDQIGQRVVVGSWLSAPVCVK